MPFRDGVFYTYAGDSASQPGSHWSAAAGTTPPSLLHSPLSQSSSKGYSSIPPTSMTPPSSGSASVPPTRPFRFQSRREAVDWRRVGALSVDRVVSEVDVDALQEHVNSVTFCSVEAELCQRCHAPLDPALLKLFRLAQLTVEWLLHCQGVLARNLQATEERLEASERGREQLALGQKEVEENARSTQQKIREKNKTFTRKQEEKIRELRNELEQREKIIRTQQTMFAPGVITNRKCPHCDKTFINAGFLQNHMQRRHPDEYDTQLQSDQTSRSQMENLRKENNNLKEQLIQQQQTLLLKAAQEKEQQSKYNELQKELDHLKALEAAWRREESRDTRDGRREEVDRGLQSHAILKLEQQLKEQDRKWELRMQEIKTQHDSENEQDRKWESRIQEMEDQHESEKSQWWDEMSRLQAVMSEQQKRSLKIKELERRLKEKDCTITEMKKISSNPPPAKSAKTPPVILTAPAPEPKAKRVVLEEPVPSAPQLEPIAERSDEDRDSSLSEVPSLKKRAEPRSERRRGVSGVSGVTAALRRNPNIRKELRPALEQALNDKLEELGVPVGQRGLRGKDLTSILTRLRSSREKMSRTRPDLWTTREDLLKTLETRMKQGSRDPLESRGKQGSRDPLESRGKQGTKTTDHRQGTRDHRPSSTEPRAKDKNCSPQVSQSRGHVTQVVQQQARTPQPAPRSKVNGPPLPVKTSTPNYRTTTPTRTSPFSSESEEEEDDLEEEDAAPQNRHQGGQWGTAAKARPGVPASTTGVPASRLGVPSSKQQPPPPSTVTQTAVTTLESAEEWSDVSELQEIDPQQLSSYQTRDPQLTRDPQQHSNKTKGQTVSELTRGQTVSELTRAVERQQAADRGHKRPPGGVSVLPGRKDVVQELMYTDVEDCSDWLTSSMEDEGSKAMKKTLESSSTSAWGTSTGNRNQRSGVAEAGTTGSTLQTTGSTVKSSLVSLSDLSDSEDI